MSLQTANWADVYQQISVLLLSLGCTAAFLIWAWVRVLGGDNTLRDSFLDQVTLKHLVLLPQYFEFWLVKQVLLHLLNLLFTSLLSLKMNLRLQLIYLWLQKIIRRLPRRLILYQQIILFLCCLVWLDVISIVCFFNALFVLGINFIWLSGSLGEADASCARITPWCEGGDQLIRRLIICVWVLARGSLPLQTLASLKQNFQFFHAQSIFIYLQWLWCLN